MNEAQRRLLTEMIGECWHEWEPSKMATLKCTLCGKWIYEKHAYEENNSRTFTTGDDMLLVKAAIEKAGKWEDFYWESYERWLSRREPQVFGDPALASWLIDNLCSLAAEWAETQP